MVTSYQTTGEQSDELRAQLEAFRNEGAYAEWHKGSVIVDRGVFAIDSGKPAKNIRERWQVLRPIGLTFVNVETFRTRKAAEASIDSRLPNA